MPPETMNDLNNEGPPLSTTTDMPAVETAVVETPEVETPEADPAVETPETPEAETVETPEGEAAVTEDEPAKPAVEAKPKRTGINDRFKELTDARKEAEGRADKTAADLSAALATIKTLSEKPVETKPVVETPQDLRPQRPKRETFETPDAYDKALDTYDTELSSWTTRQATAAARAQVDKERLETSQRTQRETEETQRRTYIETTAKTWKERSDAFTKDHPDFQEVAYGDTTITNFMGSAIVEADNGPAIAYHLGTHPEIALEIAKLTPMKQTVAIGKLASELEQAAKPVASKAPRPIQPLRSSASATPKTPSEMSMSEYAEFRQAQLRKSRAN